MSQDADYTLAAGELHKDVRLSVGGVVIGPRGIMMHPESFREVFGEIAFQELLARPRIVTSYDIEADDAKS